MQNESQRAPRPTAAGKRSAAEVQEWLICRLSEELQIGRDKIKVDQPIFSLGIDSVQIVSVVAQLEDWGGFRFAGNPLEDYATVESLARHVAELTG